MAAASPVAAHSTTNANDHLASELVSAPAGLEVQVTSDGSQLTARTTGNAVSAVIEGYHGEPFLRFRGGAVATNAASLTTYDATEPLLDTIPTDAGQAGVVRWESTGQSGWFRWTDHRISFTGSELPAAVMDDPGTEHVVEEWSIPVTVDGKAGAITGRVVWLPTEGSQTLTIIGCVGFVALVLAGALWLALPSRKRS